jgi:deleted-in-malignant-brain-tumors protein 1
MHFWIYITGFNLTLDRDDIHADTHGEVMVNMNGIWGSICMKGWSVNESNVVCRNLGFKGGVPYLVPSNKNYKRPILMSDVRCTGLETSLAQCTHNEWYQGSSCTYKDKRAGVLCYTQPSKSIPMLILYIVD